MKTMTEDGNFEIEEIDPEIQAKMPESPRKSHKKIYARVFFESLFGICLVLLGIGIAGVLRCGNVSMTETELFFTFWWQWLVVGFFMLTGAYLVGRNA